MILAVVSVMLETEGGSGTSGDSTEGVLPLTVFRELNLPSFTARIDTLCIYQTSQYCQ